MVEQIINDGLGNIITLKYDDSTDSVLIKNSNVHEDFRKIYLNNSSELVEEVITIEDRNGPDEWNTYTDEFGRWEMQLFWEEHKKDKATRGLN